MVNKLLRQYLKKSTDCFLVVLLVLVCTYTAVQAAEKINLYTYHASPPFVVEQEDNKGLTYDLADYLTQQADGKYQFSVRVLPRARLNELLTDRSDGVIPWVNSLWFGDKEETRYLWSGGYFPDSEAILSNYETPFDYDGPRSLFGMRVGCVSGYRYPSIDGYVKEGNIVRHNVRNQLANLQMVLSGRSDVAFMPRITSDYYLEAMGIKHRIHYSEKPESTYERQFLILNQRQDLAAFIRHVAAGMQRDPTWLSIALQYR